MVMNVAQIRAARGLLGWSQQELADAAGVGRATIADFETGKRTPYARTIEEMQRALESAGVVFLESDQAMGEGVRFSGV
ncbi:MULTISPECIES: helix-turn-helix transcriptional regulator [unclassified Phyllobacterium]|uniref:helix-turn-helix transcriptional regulator n=1 Tax=unclassified Phyllobacterium TaxID=2638441 RepID=UPI003012F80C